MRLLVVSHTPHYRRGPMVVGWAPTIHELDQLASRFTVVRHVACLYPTAAPSSSVAYRSNNITLVPVPPSGGDGLLGKLDALRAVPIYARTIDRELRTCDVVHVRAPANIALVAMLMLASRKSPAARWFKYAGNWSPTRRESASYTLQRLLLKNRELGLVTVNGRWSDQPAWIRSFDNPSLTTTDLEQGSKSAADKQLASPMRLLFVGQLLESKGIVRALDILGELLRRGYDVTLDVIGDGTERATFEQHGRELGLGTHVRWLGWQAPEDVRLGYATAHVLLLPSASEGWPKVLSEAMAYGAVPLAGAVSSIPQYLEELRTGACFAPEHRAGFVNAIIRYIAAPSLWKEHSRNAVSGASRFSFARYLTAVDALLSELRIG